MTLLVSERLVLKKILYFASKRGYCSALYVTGDRAVDTCPTVTPYIDFHQSLNDIRATRLDLLRRRSPIDVDKLQDALKFFLGVQETKKILQERKTTIGETLSQLFNSNRSQELDKIKIHMKIVKEDLKNLKTALWPIEEQLAIKVLSLPNNLHPSTPDERVVITGHNENDVAKRSKTDHIEKGHSIGCLAFSGPYNYYLKSNAALFELQAKFHFSRRMRDYGYVQFSNPDFAKSAVVEGCGLDHRTSSDVFILHHHEESKPNENARLHLTGGGSLLSFAAYHARNIVRPSALPLRYHCLGRQYKPVSETSKLGLFKVSQASAVELFAMSKDCDGSIDAQFNRTVSETTDIYKEIDFPFRVSRTSASELRPWESARVSFEMYSSFYERYIEVAFLSLSGDYVTKRLQCVYDENGQQFFPRIVSGTVLNVPKLLGFALELGPPGEIRVPEVFKNVL